MAERDPHSIPLASIIRLYRHVVPDLGIASDAKTQLYKLVHMFVLNLTSAALFHCRESKRMMVNADDILMGLEDIDCDHLLDGVYEYLRIYQERGAKPSSGRRRGAGAGGDEGADGSEDGAKGRKKRIQSDAIEQALKEEEAKRIALTAQRRAMDPRARAAAERAGRAVEEEGEEAKEEEGDDASHHQTPVMLGGGNDEAQNSMHDNEEATGRGEGEREGEDEGDREDEPPSKRLRIEDNAVEDTSGV